MADVSIDDKILGLFNVVAKQKEAVAAAELETKKSWITNCSLVIDDKQPVNIQTASEKVLIKSLSYLIWHEEYVKKAAELLGVDKANVSIDQWSVDDWVADFKKRLAIIQISAKKRKLAELEERLNLIVSPEQRRALELANIMKDLDV